MPRLTWKWLLSMLPARQSRSIGALRRAHLNLEGLEDRSVPSATPTVDLSTAGAVGEINGAIFRQFDARPTGTGYIDSFVRLQAKGAGTQSEQGYNTDARPVQFDENTSPQFTRSLLLSNVPLVDIGGVQYREFLLDINQKASQPLLSLDQLRLYQGGSGNLVGYDSSSHLLAGLVPIYDMDQSADNWVKLNARLSTGSGSGDMLLYVPNSDFVAGGGQNVYLYSKFGENYMASSGFEEWAVGKGGLSVTGQTGGSSGTITGTILDSNGNPVANAIVFLDTNGNNAVDSSEVYTVTDQFGHYTFSSLATGLGALTTYTVGVIPPNSDYLTAAELIVSLQTSDQTAIANFTLTLNPGGGSGV